jgi:hypothetical protein
VFESVPQGAESICEALELLEMERREPLQGGAASAAEREPDDTTVRWVLHAGQETGRPGPLDQLDRAVVSQQERVRDITDRRARFPRMASDGEQELMLRGSQSDDPRLLFAPVQEAPKPGPEIQQAAIVVVNQPVRCHREWHHSLRQTRGPAENRPCGAVGLQV